MTHSQELMKNGICAGLCVRVSWKGLKNVAMLMEDILRIREIANRIKPMTEL